ncbi:MAG: hypothetical protein HRU51_08425, partial [Xanthomonadales bacterium]|nr:hypothetical protein [Xanthomonadales bacterium]
YKTYQWRLYDNAARLRTLGTLLWLRKQAGSGRPVAELLASQAAMDQNPGLALSFQPETQVLRLPLLWTGRGSHWTVPLPGSRVDRTQSVPAAAE